MLHVGLLHQARWEASEINSSAQSLRDTWDKQLVFTWYNLLVLTKFDEIWQNKNKISQFWNSLFSELSL